jgi:hypothetical protein
MKCKSPEKDMKADDSNYWGLFENRPAKERTSPASVDQGQRHVGGQRWPATPRQPRNREERVKC